MAEASRDRQPVHHSRPGPGTRPNISSSTEYYVLLPIPAELAGAEPAHGLDRVSHPPPLRSQTSVDWDSGHFDLPSEMDAHASTPWRSTGWYAGDTGSLGDDDSETQQELDGVIGRLGTSLSTEEHLPGTDITHDIARQRTRLQVLLTVHRGGTWLTIAYYLRLLRPHVTTTHSLHYFTHPTSGNTIISTATYNG